MVTLAWGIVVGATLIGAAIDNKVSSKEEDKALALFLAFCLCAMALSSVVELAT